MTCADRLSNGYSSVLILIHLRLSALICGCRIPIHLRLSAFICGCILFIQPAQAQGLPSSFSVDGAQPSASADVVDVAVRLPRDGAQAGTTFEVFVMVRVAEGWHVNAHEPSMKYLIGTTLDVEPSEDLRVEAAYYPDPLFRTFAFADDTLAVYEGEIAIILAMRAAETLAPGTHTLESRLRVQACNDEVCLRPSTVDVPISVEIVDG